MDKIDWDYLKYLPDRAPSYHTTLVLAAQWYSYKKIADLRGTSYNAVKNAMLEMRKRSGAKNSAHLIHLAYEIGIV